MSIICIALLVLVVITQDADLSKWQGEACAFVNTMEAARPARRVMRPSGQHSVHPALQSLFNILGFVFVGPRL